ncbi:MAG: hypothetical protein ACYTFG_09445, partial [Planctomycetota bacterium]
SGEARAKAIALLSGGLDSTLAVQQMVDQGIEVLALNFTSPFCTCSPKNSDSCHMASEVARRLNVKIRVLSKGEEFLRIVERPRFGHGRGVNPCIDCRIFMLRKASEIMEEVSASFVITGEVLGQRPMSQHRRALDLIEKESGLKGRLLRPLSAKHLPPTIAEKEGIVDREALLAIHGRSRKEQLSMAENKGIDMFSCPAGGCLLTEEAVAKRARDLMARSPGFGMTEARLITLGRHFRLHEGLKIILGHDERENDRLAAIGAVYPRAELEDGPCPLALICGDASDSDLKTVGGMLWFYAKKVEGDVLSMKIESPEGEKRIPIARKATAEEIETTRI